jgi:uncharacterized protein
VRIGLISDTHGVLRDSALAALRGSDQIIHGGDIGNASVLAALSALAPLTAVRGNNDIEPWAQSLPEQARLQFQAVAVLVVHDLNTLVPLAAGAQPRVIVSGHSHKGLVREAQGILYVNPGSAGPRRFRLPISIAQLLIEGSDVQARLIELPA